MLPLPPLHSPEFRLLVACSSLRERAWPEQRQTLERLVPVVDWTRFHALVERHRLQALSWTVLYRLQKECGMLLPVPEALRLGARRVRLNNLALHAELCSLREAFAAAGIPLLPLKGTPLSQRLYGDVGMRQMKDIDVLVPPAHLSAALRLLGERGYLADVPERLLRESSLKLVRRVWRHIEYRHPERNNLVELHWSFEHQPTALEQQWWRWPVSEDDSTRGLYELLYLCLHGADHGWHRLKWLGDVHVLLAELDWEHEGESLLRLSAELRLDVVLTQTLLLLHQLYGMPLQAPAREFVERHEVRARPLVAVALRCLEAAAPDLRDGKPGRILDHLRVQRGLAHRYRPGERLHNLWLLYAYRQGDIVRLQLPPALHGLYPLLRPFSLLLRLLRR